MDPAYAVTGLLVGFLVGLTGMGGGSLMTPLLILVLHMKPSVAVGSDLAYSAITKWVGTFQHNRQKTVDHKLSLQLAIGSVPGSLLGIWFVHHLYSVVGGRAETFIVRMLGIMLIVVAVALIFKNNPTLKAWGKRLHVTQSRWRLGIAILTGLVLGFLVGITSVGSGTLFGVVLIVVFGLGTKRMVGTDVFHAAMLTTAAAIGQFYVGKVNLPLVGNLLIGSIPGVLLGSMLSARLPEKVVRPVLATVLFISGVNVLR